MRHCIPKYYGSTVPKQNKKDLKIRHCIAKAVPAAVLVRISRLRWQVGCGVEGKSVVSSGAYSAYSNGCMMCITFVLYGGVSSP